MMSEKRFGYGETDLFEWVEDNGEMISTKECVNKLNEQQATNDYLEESNSRLQIQLGETLRLVDEQQATIEAKERRIMILENLLTQMGVKWVDDDE